jgi:hypothetical protein
LNPVAEQIRVVIKGDNWWTPGIPNAHNGMLEFLLEIGVVGTMFFLFLLLRNLVLAGKCLMIREAGQFGVSSVLLLTSILLFGVSEDVLLAGQQLCTGLFFMMGFICEKQLWLARAREGDARHPTVAELRPQKALFVGRRELARTRSMR